MSDDRRFDKQIAMSGAVGLFVAVVISQVVEARLGLDMEGRVLGLASFVVPFILVTAITFGLLAIKDRNSC